MFNPFVLLLIVFVLLIIGAEYCYTWKIMMARRMLLSLHPSLHASFFVFFNALSWQHLMQVVRDICHPMRSNQHEFGKTTVVVFASLFDVVLLQVLIRNYWPQVWNAIESIGLEVRNIAARTLCCVKFLGIRNSEFGIWGSRFHNCYVSMIAAIFRTDSCAEQLVFSAKAQACVASSFFCCK